MEKQPRRGGIRWFKLAIGGGFVLAIVLVLEALGTYRYVARHLVRDHLNREAGRYVSLLESRARLQNPEDPERLEQLLRQIQEGSAHQVAWFRVLNRDGTLLAGSGVADGPGPSDDALQAIFDLRVRNIVEMRSSPGGDVLVALLPFRFQFPSQRSPSGGGIRSAGSPRFKLAEVALYLHGTDDPYQPLRRNLVVSLAASSALVAFLALLALRLRMYLRGRELENQLAVAHRVQQTLLPAESFDASPLVIASDFVPFWGVGGDYFDVVSLGRERTILVLGDVSGKGLPAALIMGLLHGAVRSASAAWDGSDLAELAHQANDLLCSRTAPNRFVTLFWACYEPAEDSLRFVNAGHNPPLLLRRMPAGPPQIETLSVGGPVLGLLPQAVYRQGDVRLRPGDRLVLFSDGLIEAANPAGVEFGPRRVEEALREHGHLEPHEIKREILQGLRSFLDGEQLQDDMTLLVVGVGPTDDGPIGPRLSGAAAVLPVDA